MTEYKIVLELELSADSPLEAAKTAQEWEKNSDLQYYVQDSKEVVFSVDLSESDEDAVIETDNYIPLIK